MTVFLGRETMCIVYKEMKNMFLTRVPHAFYITVTL